MNRLFHFALAFSQLLNVIAGSGYADEAFSAFAHRVGGWRRTLVNSLFFWQDDHCRDAYWSEWHRKQLPPEYANDRSRVAGRAQT